MDGVDSERGQERARISGVIAGVRGVHGVRLRWMGHNSHAELHLTVDEDRPTRQSHQIAEQVRQILFEAQPRLAAVLVYVDPCGRGGTDPHSLTAHRQQACLA